MNTHSVAAPWTTGITDNTTADGIFIPATGWVSTGQVQFIRVVWELITLLANLGARPAYQTSDTIDGNTATYPIDTTFRTASDVYFPTQWHDASANVAGKQLMRFGWQTRFTSTPAAITAGRMMGKFEYKLQ